MSGADASVKTLDRIAIEDFLIPPIMLMENAGIACAEEVMKFKPKRVVIFCGKGNNGGDGFVAARHLFNKRVNVSVVYFQDPSKLKPDALVNYRILEKLGVPLKPVYKADFRRELRAADVTLDALFGTGLSMDVEEPFRSAIEAINTFGKNVVSVDVPSGLHAQTGVMMGPCVEACVTVTFGRAKKGFRKKDGPRMAGRVVVKDISLPPQLLKGRK